VGFELDPASSAGQGFELWNTYYFAILLRRGYEVQVAGCFNCGFYFGAKNRRKKSRLRLGEAEENTSGCFPLQEGIRKLNNSISQFICRFKEKSAQPPAVTL
jgi:hypothetical protein